MIQAVNSVKNVSASNQSNQAFGCRGIVKNVCALTVNGCFPPIRRQSKFERIMNEAGRNFLAGAVISAVFDGIHNGVNAMRKCPEGIIKFGDVAKRAGVWGACWVAASAVLTMLFPIRR